MVARSGEDTRPLSLSNTDGKLLACALNQTFSHMLPEWALYQQRGFIKSRAMIDNIIDMDAAARTAARQHAGRAALVFFDFAAAFPSIAWEFMWMVLEFIGLHH